MKNRSCLQEFKSEKNASRKIGKPTLLLTISSQIFTNNIERKNHICNFACNRSNSECNNNIEKTICVAAEKRGIEKVYNFFFHKQILECHKNNHTEKKKKKKKTLFEWVAEGCWSKHYWLEGGKWSWKIEIKSNAWFLYVHVCNANFIFVFLHFQMCQT